MTGGSIPLLCLEGVPHIPGAPQDEAGLKEIRDVASWVVTCRNTPISRPTLEKNPMPEHLFEGNPVDEGTK